MSFSFENKFGTCKSQSKEQRREEKPKFLSFKVYMTDFFICLIESKWHPDRNIKNYFLISIFLPRAFAV